MKQAIRRFCWGVCCYNARGQGRVWNRKSNPKAYRYLTFCSHIPECILTTTPLEPVLIRIIACHFQFPFNLRIRCSKWEPFCVPLLLVRHVVPLIGYCCLTMPVGKGLCLAVCVRSRATDRHLIEIGRDIISTNHITENFSRSNWNTSRCNYSQWHPAKLVAIQLSMSQCISGLSHSKKLVAI